MEWQWVVIENKFNKKTAEYLSCVCSIQYVINLQKLLDSGLSLEETMELNWRIKKMKDTNHKMASSVVQAMERLGGELKENRYDTKQVQIEFPLLKPSMHSVIQYCA